MTDYTKLSQNDLNNSLKDACTNGDLELAKYLISSNELHIHADISHNKWQAIKLATAAGHIEVVKYFLEDIQNHYPNIVFNVACQNGKIEILKHLFTTEEFQSQRNPIWYYGCLSATTEGQAQVLDYFLNTTEFSQFIQNEKIDEFFTGACSFGHISVLEYLIKLPRFIQNNSLNDACNKGLINACDNNEKAVIRYLIFNLNMNPTIETKDYLAKAGREDIKELFNLRELNKNLQLELDEHQAPNKKIKI
jgi:hypothetical protein